MDKYYDEFATNCEGCGWLKGGEFPDGMPYLACRWFGTIMTRQSDSTCKAARTPEQAERYLGDMTDKKRRNK